ncbi:uncharacterized protein N7459_000894 [Penicillium hispanicum]|uniref:uncharacterized protein n=1 Tax=Penicillium hispanicum TaxID=1080232 RepID=UPI0025410C22|nr:uncharacterized protein N7459_000894 [Penicillium hispanicum]KAJ5594686.1 hypothetical protein N7459_000894 [Penicillium hispanicum]
MVPHIGKLCEYEKGESSPTVHRLSIALKKNEGALELDIPDHGLVRTPLAGKSSAEEKRRLERIEHAWSIHGMFRLRMHSLIKKRSGDPLEQAVGELKAISLLFPDLRAEHIRICMAAWLAILCAVDDILEVMDTRKAQDAIRASIAILKRKEKFYERSEFHGSSSGTTDTDNYIVFDLSPKGEVRSLMLLFRDHCCSFLSDAAAQSFFDEICLVFHGFMQEIEFQEGRLKCDLQTYMGIRTRTIGVAPFLTLIRDQVFPSGDYPDVLLALQTAMIVAVSLQNDLVGLEKDMEEHEPMNAVILTMRTLQANGETRGSALADAIIAISTLHNSTIEEAVHLHRKVMQESRTESELAVANSLLILTETHFRWCTTAKRYGTVMKQA